MPMPALDRKSRKRLKRAPIKDVALAIARCLLVRALREANMHHAIAGAPCVVGIVVANAADFDVFGRAARLMFQRVLRETGTVAYKILEFESGAMRGFSRDVGVDAATHIASNTHVFGLATDAGDFPPAFRLAADGIATISETNASAILAAARSVGIHNLPERIVEGVIATPLTAIGAVIRPGRSSLLIFRGLEQLQNTAQVAQSHNTRSETTLDDLHGLGAASDWGLALAADLKAFQAGEIDWVDVDRGVLISGPSGTGKTTFAQALARTCGVPIHVHSLARWQAKGYLNDLLKAMRRAFDDARHDAPSILFIDELDSFGNRDTLNGRNENYEREVINGFLECLDGVEGREGVVVVGATNLPEKIDSAILRPGRLGKHIRIQLPDVTARLGILRHHLRDSSRLSGLMGIAIRLEGASGAVIEQVVRDARRKARVERRSLTIADLEHGLPRRVRQSENAFARACAHEAGHALTGYLLEDETGRRMIEARTFREISLHGDPGWTVFEQIEGGSHTKKTYLAQIVVLLSGLAAEAIAFGEYGDGGGGADDCDLRRATLIAATLQTSYGLGDDLVFITTNSPSDVLARVQADRFLHRRVAKMLAACFQRATEMVNENSTSFNEIAQVLERSEVIVATDVERVVTSHRANSG
jgi:AAA+ superfamily predicted ATPase